MGVTLERVQNKFACIIGELCGEPKILSQFAVWLDLRLAEYKSKGSISLECSGFIPEPSWLEGLILKKSFIQQASSATNPPPWFAGHAAPRPAFGRACPDNTRNAGRADRSPDVVVKSEPPGGGDDSFAYIRECAGYHTPHEAQKRKQDTPRHAPDVAHQEHYQSPVASKRSRLSGSSTNFSPATGEGDSADITILASPPNPDTNDELTDRISQSTNNTDRPMPVSRLAEEDLVSSGFYSHPGLHGHAPHLPVVAGLPEGMGGYPEGLITPWISPRNYRQVGYQAQTGERRNCQTAKNILSAATTFERWLASKEGGERQPMAEIPPVELDNYLTEFFSTVKKRSGQDYNSDTLLSLRSYIDRYLREKGYPVSITKSEVFIKSQMSFKLRRQALLGGSLRSALTTTTTATTTTQANVPHNIASLTGVSFAPEAISISSSSASDSSSSVIAAEHPGSERRNSFDCADGTSDSHVSFPRANSPSPFPPSSGGEMLSDRNQAKTQSVSFLRANSYPQGDSHDPKGQFNSSAVQLSTSPAHVSSVSSSPTSQRTSSTSGVSPVNPSAASVSVATFSALNQAQSPDKVPVPHSDSSRSSQNADAAPSSPLDFFSDLPRMPPTLQHGTQET